MDDNWWGWSALIAFFIILQVIRGLFRGVKKAGGGMARLNAAAERILKERGAAAAPANPLPRAKPSAGAKTPAPERVRNHHHHHPPLKVASTPAVIRRGGLLSSSKEPVIQRRH